jgi:hypothetical protein
MAAGKETMQIPAFARLRLRHRIPPLTINRYLPTIQPT